MIAVGCARQEEVRYIEAAAHARRVHHKALQHALELSNLFTAAG